jgi:hypothetical protein
MAIKRFMQVRKTMHEQKENFSRDRKYLKELNRNHKTKDHNN